MSETLSSSHDEATISESNESDHEAAVDIAESLHSTLTSATLRLSPLRAASSHDESGGNRRNLTNDLAATQRALEARAREARNLEARIRAVYNELGGDYGGRSFASLTESTLDETTTTAASVTTALSASSDDARSSDADEEAPLTITPPSYSVYAASDGEYASFFRCSFLISS